MYISGMLCYIELYIFVSSQTNHVPSAVCDAPHCLNKGKTELVGMSVCFITLELIGGIYHFLKCTCILSILTGQFAQKIQLLTTILIYGACGVASKGNEWQVPL